MVLPSSVPSASSPAVPSAAIMLARRGFPVTLFYGAAMTDGELKAHVWVRSDELDVMGCENASNFAILSQFSNDSSS